MDDPTYTVFVRVPIPRGSFVDPPAVSWDSAKDEALWKILSGATQNDIDWNLVADRFEVQVDFLVQQVAYLTERHASQVRAQVRKATAAAKGSAAPSPIPGSESTGVSNFRTTSALSIRRDSPRTEGATAAAAGSAGALASRPPISRNASGNTPAPRDAGSSSLKMGSRPAARPAAAAAAAPPPAAAAAAASSAAATDTTRRRRLSSLPVPSYSPSQSQVIPPRAADGPASPEPAESSSSSSDEDSSPAQSRIIRRPPRFQQQDNYAKYRDDEDDESEPVFQRYEPVRPSNASSHDLTSTVRGEPSDARRRNVRNTTESSGGGVSQTSDSSASSHVLRSRQGKLREQQGAVPLSPRRTAELAAGRDTGSDGTPSMGSSYSDLDDTSVTQSALEEALASQINRGGRSRFSISQAFRSHYTSSSNQ